MSVSEEYVTHILDMLESLPDVTVSRMFGGALIKSGEVQIGVIINDQFYFRIQEDMREQYIAHGSEPFVYEKKGKSVTVHAWYSAPEEVIEHPDRFLEWAEEVLAKGAE